MICEKFFCKECNKYFNNPKYYYENHGLNGPPYERVAVCPECEGDDFVEFDCLIEKIEVVEKLLPIIMQLNNYIDTLQGVFGSEISNVELEGSVVSLAEMITEMFDFIDVDLQRKILQLNNEKEMNRIYLYLDGES